MIYRPTHATIYLPALKHNLACMQALAPNSKVIAMIKANGYGHGLTRVAQQLSGADAFGVASIDEANLLRQKGFLHRILLLEGLFKQAEMALVIQNRLDVVIHSQHQLDWLIATPFNGQLNVWIKIDTGMHRLGFSPQQVQSVVAQLERAENDFSVYLMTHFASADECNPQGQAFTQQQLTTFLNATQSYLYPKSLANSAATFAYPQTHFEWIRPGINLYGAGRLSHLENSARLQAVMTLKSEIIAIKTIPKGDFVGYGNTWQAQRDTLLGVVAIGYGDGYPRHAPAGTPVAVKGTIVPLVGRVSMDMITVDLTDFSACQIGDDVELWGSTVSVDTVAHYCDTISYELLCGITQRVPMVEIQ